MNDFEIRNSLHNKFLSNYKKDKDSVIVDELKVCNGGAIIDLAVVNGSLIGYEIKSACDNLKRLKSQVFHYNQVFDFITIVANDKHLDGILMEVPHFWGIWLIETKKNRVVKSVIRKPEYNNETVPFSIIQLLWKEELVDLLIKKKLDLKMKNKRRWLLWEYISNTLDSEEIKIEVRRYLKARMNWKIQTMPSFKYDIIF